MSVVNLNVVTKLDLSPDRVLEEAMGQLEQVTIVGFGKDGSDYFASSQADGADVLWHLERAKHRLMLITDEMSDG